MVFGAALKRNQSRTATPRRATDRDGMSRAERKGVGDMVHPMDEQRVGDDGSGLYPVTCPQCHRLRNSDSPERNTQSVRTLCDSCWQKRTERSENYLLAGSDRHHYVCRCGWQTWSRTTPMSGRVFGLSCFHCRKRWRQSHRCPACEPKGSS